MSSVAGAFPAAAFMASALLVLAALTLVAAPRPVAARCVEPDPIEEAIRAADVVIVGTVIAVAEEGTRATVRVEEIWRGPALAAEVVVWGGPGGRSSIDRTFEAGMRYLFTIALGEGGRLTDSLCSSTIAWDPKLVALRPPGAQSPTAAGELDAVAEPAGFDPASLVVPAGVALLVAAALLVAGLLARGRQTNR
ncbi:MAG TPA: hypothetical protein VMQ65_06595 [Candidatus Limnocylindria bacterium]|nr:hypothetical protein [Candidatus Limnocylindria bacterium]